MMKIRGLTQISSHGRFRPINLMDCFHHTADIFICFNYFLVTWRLCFFFRSLKKVTVGIYRLRVLIRLVLVIEKNFQ